MKDTYPVVKRSVIIRRQARRKAVTEREAYSPGFATSLNSYELQKPSETRPRLAELPPRENSAYEAAFCELDVGTAGQNSGSLAGS